MKRIYVAMLLLIGVQLYGQQDPQYTQYMYNMSVVNPAYAGSKAETLSLGLLYRSQWTGVDDSPRTGTFFANAPIGGNMGLGISFINDQIGPVKENNVYADFSYTLRLGGEHRLAFGIKAGATFHDIGLADLELTDANDPFFNENINSVTPNIGAGFFYYTDHYYFGFSVPNMLNSVHLDSDGYELGSEVSHYFLTGGYVFQLSENTKLKPSFMVKSAFSAPTSFDVNLNALFFERFEVGGSYRLDDSFAALVNFAITPNLRIGYAHDFVTSDIKHYAKYSSEFMLLWDINFVKKVSRSPRYF
ncbi:type IX secretion system membrane protein PorP/SprF [Mangrovimonas sp. DI 80]|uniref:PorP/SprF family type IX secretion system membrane protein n=1 Tax=Mangrovimonas sp. DI 80 TaxID=1779330 RepID=UPI000977818A|nr:type IX secretion system membrane protein PorP/SprF [Mangrovimonas sp. DI 80]OMP32085.1 hypothetical protein BKM32_03255 [Mangrovimonas sp. DI 80]